MVDTPPGGPKALAYSMGRLGFPPHSNAARTIKDLEFVEFAYSFRTEPRGSITSRDKWVFIVAGKTRRLRIGL
jgi:hypothetical protein